MRLPRGRQWVRGLWGLAALAALALGAAIAFGFGDGGNERRDATREYLRQVNTLQVSRSGELGSANRAFIGIGFGAKGMQEQAVALDKAARTIADFQSRLARLTPPEEARTLHRKLLRLYELQAEFATLIAVMRRYLPALANVENALVSASRALRSEVTAARSPAEQAGAFQRYSARLETAASELEGLDAPDVLEVARTGEIARMGRLTRLARTVSVSVAAGRTAEIPALLRRLALTASSTSTAKATRAGTIEYNRRLGTIATQRRAVERERSRLDLELR